MTHSVSVTTQFVQNLLSHLVIRGFLLFKGKKGLKMFKAMVPWHLRPAFVLNPGISGNLFSIGKMPIGKPTLLVH